MSMARKNIEADGIGETGGDPPGSAPPGTGSETGSAIVDVVLKMKLTGNVIPGAWYETILCAGGKEPRKRKAKPDRVTIEVLSEIVFWYRPSYIREGKHGRWKKRFKADFLQLDRGTLADKFKVSKRQVSRSLEKLEELGVIKRVFRNIKKGTGGAELRNVLYIELIPAGLANVSRVELPAASAGVDARVNTSGQARQYVRTPASSRVDAEVKTNTKITTQTSTLSSSSGAKRPQPGGKKDNRRNSGSAASGAAAPSPAAPVRDVPSEQTGAAAPGTPARDAAATDQDNRQQKVHSSIGMDEDDDDPEVEKAKKKADKLLRYASQAHANLLADGVVHLPLRDRLERARAPITKYLLEFPEYRVPRILQTLILIWQTDLSEHQWFSQKLKDSPSLLPKIFPGKDHSVLEGAAIEFGINLGEKADAQTKEDFADAGILESWEAEHPLKTDKTSSNQDQNHVEDVPEIEKPIEEEPERKNTAPGPVKMTDEKSEGMEPKKSPPTVSVGRAPADRPSFSRRKILE